MAVAAFNDKPGIAVIEPSEFEITAPQQGLIFGFSSITLLV